MSTAIVLSCAACGQKNRVQASRLAQGPKCGRCHAAVQARASLAVDSTTLEGLIAESSLPLLVDFWAPWCGPCRTIAPVLEEVAQARAGQVLVVKVNVDEEAMAGRRHDVQGIPALVIFSRGREARRLVGAHPRGKIEAAIDLSVPRAPADLQA